MSSRKELVGALGALLRRLTAAESLDDVRHGGTMDNAVRVYNSAVAGDIKPLPWTPLRPVGHGTVTERQVADAMALSGISEADVRATFAHIAATESLWTNDTYQVSVRDLGNGGRHLSIKRLDQEPVHDWRDLQRIKNELLGPDREAVELYPAEERKVDSANQYHLWGSNDPAFRFGFGFGTRFTTDGSASHHQRPLGDDDGR
jgi:hypothetical protein